MSRIKRLLTLLICVMLLTGCWDKVELENRAFINSVGVDICESDPDKKFTVTLSIASLDAITDDDRGGEENTKSKSIKTGHGNSITEAMNQIDSYSSQNMFFGHTKLLVIGSDVLQDEVLFRAMLDAFERNRELSRKIIVMVADGKAADIIASNTRGEPLPGLFVYSFYETNGESTTNTFKLDLEQLVRRLRETSALIIPQISAGDDGLELGGGAVVKDMHFVDWIDEEGMIGYVWYNGRSEGNPVIVKDDSIEATCTVITHDKRIIFSEDGEELICSLQVDAEMQVTEYYFGRSIRDENKVQHLEWLLEEEIARQIHDNATLMQQGFMADAADLKGVLRKKNYELWLKYAPDWDKQYQELLIIPDVKVTIRNVGDIR